ncbi:MAG: VanZ family protein, partial [Actinobacteria bacterium]|nr:VanZ family protein [Actinomycetota bacterium]
LTYRFIEFAANIVLFVPVGVLVPLAIGSLRPRVLLLAVLVGFAVSFGIEFAQTAIPGRVSDPRDVLSNTLGAAAGVVLLLLARALFVHRTARAA